MKLQLPTMKKHMNEIDLSSSCAHMGLHPDWAMQSYIQQSLWILHFFPTGVLPRLVEE